MTDLLHPRTWASPCSSLPPWQALRLGDGSIARWLGLAHGSRSMYDIRASKCVHGGSTSGVGNVGSNSELLGRVRRKRDLKCWYGRYGRGLGHVRMSHNLELRLRCCCSSSHSWRETRGGDGLRIGKGERNSCARRQGYLDVGLSHVRSQICHNQGLKVKCRCASSHSWQDTREGNHDLHVERFSGRGFGFRVLRRGVKAHAVDGPRPWFHNFLFQSIDEADYDTGEEDVGEEELDIPEFDADGVDFEPRADEAAEPVTDEVDALLEDDRRFFRWKMKNQARSEVREFQSTGRDPDGKEWEDWLDDSWNQYEDSLTGGGGGDDGWYEAAPNWDKGGVPREPPSKPERGMKRTIKELFFRIFEPEDEVVEDLQFEERVFRFTSRTTAKFVGVLIVVPVVTDVLLHDFVLAPFLQTYVEKVPLAAKVLDVRESQKLIIIEKLKLERQRVRFEAEIGKAPPLSDDELSEHIREEALELREEFRLENRQAFASIWSDFAAGLTILSLLIFNPQQVAIMRLTGERLFTNISDSGKAFIIILLTDIFLGYHSESGWETVSEMVLEHYGFEASQAAIYIFVAIVPVTIDACFKLWVFRFFRTLSPSASATFREMQRH